MLLKVETVLSSVAAVWALTAFAALLNPPTRDAKFLTSTPQPTRSATTAVFAPRNATVATLIGTGMRAKTSTTAVIAFVSAVRTGMNAFPSWICRPLNASPSSACAIFSFWVASMSSWESTRPRLLALSAISAIWSELSPRIGMSCRPARPNSDVANVVRSTPSGRLWNFA
jgi:hypothetical protein